jgi:signal transduction histidine kinase
MVERPTEENAANALWNILVVDDDEDDYILLKHMLSQARWNKITVMWVPDDEQARQAMTTSQYHAVLVDYRLGARTGIEFIRELVASAYPAPAILLTGMGSYEVDVEAMQAGAASYLVKEEVTPLLLERTIRYAIDRKKAEEALAAKNAEIQAMTQQLWHTAKLATLGELAASIAHELNNPLAIFSLRVENLASSIPEDSAVKKDLDIITEEVERMAGLVANLLQFSRIGLRQISSLDLRQEIDQTLELMKNHLRLHQIQVDRAFAAEMPLVQADRQQIRQLFLNLFTNASDAMPQGGKLSIQVRPASQDSTDDIPSAVLIEVRDTGMGIASEDLARVMEPFYSTKPEGKGTGLGLSICRRIVEEHQGTFQISSPGIGLGVTIEIMLPSASDPTPNILMELG